MKVKRYGARRCSLPLLGTVFLCAGMAVWAPPAPAWASPVTNAEKEREDAKREWDEARKEAESLEQKLDDSKKQAQELDGQLTGLLTMSNILESDMKGLETQIGEASAEYEQAKEEQERRYGILKKRVRYLYEEGDVTYLDILLKAGSIGDVVNQTEYFAQLYRYDQDMLEQYEQVKVQVLERRDKLEARQSEMEVMKQEYKTQQSDIRSLIRENEKESADFDTRLSLAREKAGKAADQVRKKNEQIRRLRAEEAQKREQERIRAEQAAREAAGQQMAGGQLGGEQPAGGQSVRPRPGSPAPVRSSGGSAFGRSVADYGLQFVGNPYVYGGTSLTAGADCSGFTQSVYRHFGVNIPRTSAQQAGFGREVAYEDMEPGDLVCYSGHVAMYIGNGQIVHASSRKEGIKVSSDPAYRTIVSIRRPWQ